MPEWLDETEWLYFSVHLLHLSAKLILISSLLIKKSCEGISGKSQILFSLAVTFENLEILWGNTSTFTSDALELTLVFLSYLTVFLVYCKFSSVTSKDNDTCLVELLILQSLIMTIVFNYFVSFLMISWIFSCYLESVAIIPQLYMIRKMRRAESVMFYYITCLALYKVLFIFNEMYDYTLLLYFNENTLYSAILQTAILLFGVWMTYSSRQTTTCEGFMQCVSAAKDEAVSDERESSGEDDTGCDRPTIFKL